MQQPPTAEAVAVALDATSSQWLPGNEITIQYGRFPGGSPDDAN